MKSKVWEVWGCGRWGGDAVRGVASGVPERLPAVQELAEPLLGDQELVHHDQPKFPTQFGQRRLELLDERVHRRPS
jgi:hypothetical protein